ncbi:MAG: histidine ammonia-lyase [Bacteroidetes bacterium RIFCSPLOWO2_02_FULL_36_8]|nr:MAG: histidine ammonia-lyase [Bacteroidetes bacterium RIFCSPLOWO2_02_FULL_36_8]
MKTKVHEITFEKLNLERIHEIVSRPEKLVLSEKTKEKILQGRNYLDEKIKKSKTPVYGVTTGFGSLYDKNISKKELEQLQTNLMLSHACGTGEKVTRQVVQIMLFLKIQSLSYGNSGVQLETVQRLLDLFNEEVCPVVYQQGSLGASGDLAPLAHLTLPLLNLGEVYYKGKRIPAEQINKLYGWKPLHLKSKEGLALLNGTQFMCAYGVWCALRAKALIRLADVIAAVSMEAFDSRPEPFSEPIQRIRPHKGQVETAAHIRDILKGSKLFSQKKKHVQDPYSFRCIPQVHGATREVIDYAERIFITEVNSISDNPNIFPEEDQIISGGNFHGQTLAFALDFLAIALTDLCSISERRTYQLVSGVRGLPNFLVSNPGLNSGLMMPQYTAASIVSQNKQLATPASVDSIVSSNGQEDHVSMGANAATKLYQVIKNTEQVIAIELLTAAQAIQFKEFEKTSVILKKFISSYTKHVPFIDRDRFLFLDLKNSLEFVKRWTR